MTQFIIKGKVKYNGKLYTSGTVVEVDEKDVAEFKKHGWQIVGEGEHKQEDDKKEEKQDFSKLTVAQLKALLTEKGIEFQDNAKKADLLALLA